MTLEELSLENKQFNIICLSETFVKSGSEGNINISGYNLAASYSRSHEKRGGVCILIRNDAQAQELTWLNEFSENFVFECCGIDIAQIKCIVICLSSNIVTFFRKLEQLMVKLKRKTKQNLVIAGDLNIDILKDNNNTNELQRIAANNNLKLHILYPTRKKACLDQILSNIPEAIGEIHKLGLSDHDTAQSVTFDVVSSTHLPKYWYCKKREYSPENISKFIGCLKIITWKNVIEDGDMSKAFNTFFEDFKLFYDLCFPISKIKVKPPTKSTNWFTKGLKKSTVTKRKLLFNYYKNPNSSSKMK